MCVCVVFLSIQRTIAPLLAKYRMQASIIKQETFMPDVDEDEDEGENVGAHVPPLSFENVYMYEIRPI